ncbi:IST1 homolog [Saccostrea echinata]|uniref:IST1 homolog n=1 Tax=Saccostrea echinata TaxID=191078 RepID=UPI002A82E7D5|nr:IST1 homolog [Saccostrea echinata]
MFSSGANYVKLKTNLRLVINRLKLLEKKKTEMASKARKEIADYISAGKDDRARIRVEHIVREDYLVEAMELLEMFCDLLLARFGLIQTQKELDPGLEEAIASIIWATPRLQADVQEFKIVTDQLTAKYGKEFGQACRTNELNNVNEKVMHKLGVQAPPKILVERYMIEIAKTYNVPFEPDPAVMNQDEVFAAENLLIDLGEKKGGGSNGGPSGGMGVLQPQIGGGASAPSYPPPSQPQYPPPQHLYQPPQDSKMPPPLPQAPPSGGIGAGGFVDPAHSAPPPQTGQQSYNDWLGEDPKKQAHSQPPPPAGFTPDTFPDLPAVPNSTLPDPGNSVGGTSAGGEDVDFDDLTRRFEQLKKRK